MPKLPARLRALLEHGTVRSVARDSSLIFGGYALQLLTQIGWLVLAVRSLGPDGYGIFASLTALTVAASCFVGWGCDQLLIRAVARDPAALRPWLGHCLGLITATGLVLVSLGMAILPVLEVGRIGTVPLLLVLVSDLLFGRYANVGIAVFMGTGQAARQSAVTIIIGLCRLVAIAIAAALPGALSLQGWASWYAASSAAAAALCLALVIRDHGMPVLRWMGGHAGEGLAFAAESALQASVRDLDKPIVLEVAGAEAAGEYAAAFRIVETVGMPVRALASASYARMFRLAGESSAACVSYVYRLIPVAAGIGAAGALGLLVFAGLLPLIFGERYDDLPYVVRLAAVFPLMSGLYGIWADGLSATGRQRVRLSLVCISLALTLLLCWAGVQAGGLEGAAIARVIVMGITAGLAWAALPSRS
ncbi:lipopolysaccharide biosynthesis protein [Roseomonas populi]|uniref:Oligosaccharide flippase family protein n=1 Tax=Roseomonas populi TaxID=3121582 RepID=A0ABT1X2J7_9PROT|nr:oligosaccharide flippase family protein [Roseomonas pecuniae]MCR0982320.1 oligosaccharide flippase family protein [Roseomonas pecuniae]